MWGVIFWSGKRTGVPMGIRLNLYVYSPPTGVKYCSRSPPFPPPPSTASFGKASLSGESIRHHLYVYPAPPIAVTSCSGSPPFPPPPAAASFGEALLSSCESPPPTAVASCPPFPPPQSAASSWGGGACFSFQVMGNGSTPYAKRELVGDGGINVAATTTKGEAAEIFGFLGWLFLCTSAWSG